MTEDRDRDEMRKLLAYANFSKVGEAIGVKRAAVANWAAGRHVTPARLKQVRALYGLPVASQDTQKEAEPPTWATRLEAKMDAVMATREQVADESVRKVVEALASTPWQLRADELIAHLEELKRLRAEDPPERTGEPGPGEVSPPGQVGG